MFFKIEMRGKERKKSAYACGIMVLLRKIR